MFCKLSLGVSCKIMNTRKASWIVEPHCNEYLICWTLKAHVKCPETTNQCPNGKWANGELSQHVELVAVSHESQKQHFECTCLSGTWSLCQQNKSLSQHDLCHAVFRRPNFMQFPKISWALNSAESVLWSTKHASFKTFVCQNCVSTWQQCCGHKG